MSNLAIALQKLADYRIKHSRASEQILKEGLPILEKQSWKKLGDEGLFILVISYMQRASTKFIDYF